MRDYELRIKKNLIVFKVQVPYNSDFIPENSGLSAENAYFWRDNF
jgi:hypothetical protein